VAAVNRLFEYAEGGGEHPGYAAGAFRFRKGENPLPFEAVDAAGRGQELVGVDGPFQALAVATYRPRGPARRRLPRLLRPPLRRAHRHAC
jgi:hypothetical protein